MKKAVALALAIGLSAASAAVAREVAGVNLPDAASVEGRNVRLNGAGLRKKAIFKVYVAGLYLEKPSNDGSAIVSSDQVKRMQLSVLRALTTKQITEAIEEGFEKNSKASLGLLKARLEKFKILIPNVEKGDEIRMTYLPGEGTKVEVKGVERGVIEGKDFADALFSVWLGPDPVQPDLKKALLGG